MLEHEAERLFSVSYVRIIDGDTRGGAGYKKQTTDMSIKTLQKIRIIYRSHEHLSFKETLTS
jgi:hypothetical protein